MRIPRLRARALSALALAAVAALALTGCQTASTAKGGDPAPSTAELPPLSELTPIPDPTSWEGPSTAVFGGPSFTLDAPAVEPQLPVTVTSKDRGGDRRITVKDASRVLAISLTGTLAELVDAYGLGDLLVGRDVSTDLPGLKDLPVVTHDGHSIDPESVLALDPTLILTDGSIGPVDVLLQLRDAGIPVVMVTRPIDAKTTYEAAQQLADALGVAPLAEKLIPQLKQAIADKEAEIARLVPKDPARKPRIAFLYIRGTAGIYYLFGEGSGIDSTIRSLGAIDVAREIGWKGEKPMTDEALIALDPDILIVMSSGLESAGGIDGLLAAKPAIALTNAGEHRRIIDADDSLLFAGGTRIPDVLDGLARAVYSPDSL